MRALFFTFFLCSLLHSEDPWGKMLNCPVLLKLLLRPFVILHLPVSTTFFGPLAEKIITFHQEVISPADGPRSHYIPSSSQYMLDAIRKYGFFSGYPMGCDRLMRENNDPWVYRKTLSGNGLPIKYDPVP